MPTHPTCHLRLRRYLHWERRPTPAALTFHRHPAMDLAAHTLHHLAALDLAAHTLRHHLAGDTPAAARMHLAAAARHMDQALRV